MLFQEDMEHAYYMQAYDIQATSAVSLNTHIGMRRIPVQMLRWQDEPEGPFLLRERGSLSRRPKRGRERLSVQDDSDIADDVILRVL